MRIGGPGGVALLVVGLVVAPAGRVRAQHAGASIVGRVYDSEGAGAVAGAMVDLTRKGANGAPRSAVTGPTGEFAFRGLPAGTYTLEVDAPRYRTLRRTIVLRAGQAANLDLALTPTPIELPGIHVETTAGTFIPGFVRRRETRKGIFLTRSDLDSLAPEFLSQALRSRAHVRLRYQPPGSGGWNPSGFRVLVSRQVAGTPYCRPTLILNGTKLDGSWHLDDFEPKDVLAMEVYWDPSQVPGLEHDGYALQAGALPSGAGFSAPGAPALFGPYFTRCGAILIWTQLRPPGWQAPPADSGG